MTREETIDSLRSGNFYPEILRAAADHLTRDTRRERLDRMVAVYIARGVTDMDVVIEKSVRTLSAIDAECERGEGK